MDLGVATLSEPSRNVSISVGTSSTIIADIRPSAIPRRDILVRNISSSAADIISVALGTTQAVANTGIVLRQNESFSFSSETGNPSPQCQFSAICATANGTVSIFER
jgi:hypothetical protein